MSKIKMPKSAPSLDMTPMVDLAFLLVTFFMLSASFRTSEPVQVDTPASHSDKILPENVILITVDPQGRAFFNMSGIEARKNTLDKMAAQYKTTFTAQQKERFALMSSFGVTVQDLPKYIDMADEERAKVKTAGIPLDSTNNQMKDWISFGRLEALKLAKEAQDEAKAKGRDFDKEKYLLRYAIKADGKAPYISVKQVIQTFTDMEIYRFNLITGLEQEAKTE